MSTPRLAPRADRRRLLLASPVGPLLAEYDDAGVRALHWWPQGAHPPAGTRVQPTRDDALGWRLAEELREYFAGARRDFTVPLAPEGTEFRLRVWEALRTIPYGETRTYRDLAAMVGAPKGMQAVGQANRHNPIPILIPCHRVTAVGGIGGYAGEHGAGERIDTKRHLLRLEGATPPGADDSDAYRLL